MNLLNNPAQHVVRARRKRFASLSFIASSSTCSINPIQRGGREYKREDVEKWLKNYHSKLDFFMEEIMRRSLPEQIEKSVIIWYHDHRNEQYHGGSRGVPEKDVLEGIREASSWVFSVLFEICDNER